MPSRSRNIRVSFTAITPKRLVGIDPQVVAQIKTYTRDVALELIQEAVKDYQRVPETYTYARTFTLLRSWDLQPTRYGGGTGWVITNNASGGRHNRPYAAFVQGPKQTWWHELRGWRTVQDLLDNWGGNRRLRIQAQDIINQAIRR